MKNKLLAGMLAVAMSVTLLAGCGSSESSNEDSAQEETTEAAEETGDPTAQLSAVDYDLETNYYFNDFNAHSLADTDRQGIETYESEGEVVYEDLTYAEFIDLLQKEGNYMIALAGSWCHNSRAMTPSLSKFAKEYGIDTIYTYDFDLDNKEDGNTFVRMTNGSENAGVNYNYMYGEVIQQYLTNMDDWIEYPSSTKAAITYTNANGEDQTIARAQQPIAFIYNKDNTVDNSGSGNESGKCPIVYAFEKMVDRDAEGVYVKEKDDEGNEVTDDDGNPVKNYITEEYEAEMQKMFDFVKDNNIEFAEYSEDDYMRAAYPALADAEQINVKPVTYRQFAWLLQQDGNAIYMVGGAYDEATQNEIADVNAKAIEENVNVYLFDPYVDGKISEDEWGYTNTGDIMQSETIGFMYTNLIEDSLTNLMTDEFDEGDESTCLTYTNGAGKDVTVPVLKAPYVFSYNKAATDEDGVSAPIMAYSESADTLAAVFDAYNEGIAK
ncbi:MAG: hypothetical protein ACI4V6_01230 [Dorea sp.]